MSIVNCTKATVTPSGITRSGQHHAKPNQCFCLTVCEYRRKIVEVDPPHNCDEAGEFGATPAELKTEAKSRGCCGAVRVFEDGD